MLRELLRKLNHSRWTLLAPLGLAVLASFTGNIVRAVCLVSALVISIWIVHDTEFAKGAEAARHSRGKHISRTLLAACVLTVLAVVVFLVSNRIEAYGRNLDKNQNEVGKAETKIPALTGPASSASAPSQPNKLPTGTENPKAPLKEASAPPVDPQPLTSSIVRNAGTIQDIQISNAKVFPPAKGQATIIDTTPGSQINKARLDNVQVGSAASPVGGNNGHASIGVRNGINGIFQDVTDCSDGPTYDLQGITTSTIQNSRHNDPAVCNWVFLMDAARRHRQDIGQFIDWWDKSQEGWWENLPDSVKKKYRKEVAGIRQKLVDASADPDKFYDATLQIAPPSFEVRIPK